MVFAWREPAIFVNCEGPEILTKAGVEVIEMTELADEVRGINKHVLKPS